MRSVDLVDANQANDSQGIAIPAPVSTPRATLTRSPSQEVLDEWDWTEHFSPQPETLKYINFLTEKFDLKRDMQFDTRVRSSCF